MKKISMVTCSGELGTAHVPITFEGHFIALCPLCAEIERVKEAEARGEECIDFNQAEHDKHIGRLEDKLAAAREELAALADDAAALLAAAKMVQEAFVHKPGPENAAGNKARTAPFKYANEDFAPALTALRIAITKIEKGE